MVLEMKMPIRLQQREERPRTEDLPQPFIQSTRTGQVPVRGLVLEYLEVVL